MSGSALSGEPGPTLPSVMARHLSSREKRKPQNPCARSTDFAVFTLYRGKSYAVGAAGAVGFAAFAGLAGFTGLTRAAIAAFAVASAAAFALLRASFAACSSSVMRAMYLE